MFMRVVVLLGLMAAATNAAGTCAYRQFRCADRSECISAMVRCDGSSDCPDHSDEKGCDAFPTVPLPVNATVTARVQYKEEHQSINVDLCSDRQCSSLKMFGVREDGSLQYAAWTGCNLLGSRCSVSKTHWEGAARFVPGEVVLEVQHRPRELAVWRKGRPNDVARVSVEADSGTLRIRPFLYTSAMPVKFSRA